MKRYLNHIPGNVAGPANNQLGECVNWFGNNPNWTKIEATGLYQRYGNTPNTPWGATPYGCTEEVKQYGEYLCAVDTGKKFIDCPGDCKNGGCV